MTTKDTDTHNTPPVTEPLALRLSEGLGAGAETRYLRPWQMHALCGLGAVGGLFCFWLGLGAPGLDPLFRVLVGAGVGVVLPFAGAMVTGAK